MANINKTQRTTTKIET